MREDNVSSTLKQMLFLILYASFYKFGEDDSILFYIAIF